MKIVEYVRKNWNDLPKSLFDGEPVVIFKEITNEDYGYGHHTYEGVGIGSKGELLWCYSSGCSCNGHVTVDHSDETSVKIFESDESICDDIDPSTVNFKNLEVVFDSY